MSTAVAVPNPFGDRVPATVGGMMDVAAQREIAEVQGAIVSAKRFPRDQISAAERIITACQRPTLAEQALYTYSRGGTDISGPSIRLAEAISQAWGNMQIGVRELEQRNGESIIESYAWDLETNTKQSKVFTVKHERHTKRGSYQLSDPRDIYELAANQGARRLRACILAIIPGDVVEAAVKQCEETLKAKADTSPAAIAKMVTAFEGYGVTKDQIEKRIQRRIDSITPAQVISLRKVFNSLKDGMSTPTDWFEPAVSLVDAPAVPKNGGDALKAALKKPKQDPAPVKVQEVELAPEPCPAGGPMAGDNPTAEFCGKCQSRDGCPSWPVQI